MPKIKFLMDEQLEVELFVKNEKQYVFIASDSSSGCEYQVNTFEDIGKRIAEYVEHYVHNCEEE